MFLLLGGLFSLPFFHAKSLEGLLKHEKEAFNALNTFCEENCSNCQFKASYCTQVLYKGLDKICAAEENDNCFSVWLALSDQCEKSCPIP